MTKRVLPLTEFKTNLPRIVKGVEKREEEIVVTRNGRPAAVMLNYEEFQRLKATLDVLNDRHLMKQIRRSRAYYKKKRRGLTFEDVFDEPF